ncbi:MAG: tetratricopeptide repeat protein [Thiobacillus sp.]|nr:tetratricopeptide repeat protein [Thiobacillus sp.]
MSNKNILLRTKKKKALTSFQAKRYDEAWSLYQGICQADRLDADARLACGVIAGLRGDNALAADYCRQAVALDPKLAVAHFNLGIALRSQNRFEEACQSFKRAIALLPNYIEAMEALAHAYIALYDWPAAVQVLNEIIAIWPHKAEIHSDLGTIYQAMGRSQDAITAYETALKINPRLGVALNSLGSAYQGQGDFEQAERCYRQCLAATPGDLQARSNLLMLLNYLPDADAATVFKEHLEWGRIARTRILLIDPIELDQDPRRRLRVGYLSPDFREHSVASFIEPVLRHHDRSRFDVWCYSNLPTPDETTKRLKAAVDGWRDIDKLSDGEAARLIRDDRIDILVDLSGHTANNRLGIFAAKPAPVQMTWMGYPNTTGLNTIDYRITDRIADPAGEEAYYSEAMLRLDDCFLCYQPDPNTPEVAPLPALTNGHITFGSFNNFSKINRGVLQLWAAVLKQVPNSHLLLKCPALTDATVRASVSASLQELGVGTERIDLLGHTRTRQEHLALYAKVDIALDTFPYNGTTTTCEALLMGVPVLSLVGKHHAGRVGASLLKAAGLTDWLADTSEALVANARARATDVAGLDRLRRSLRGQLAGSSLCDAKGFVNRFEAVVLQAWASRISQLSPRR